MLPAGHVIDRYVIQGPIGQGACATVYRATHVRLESQCAIKVLNVGSKTMMERLLLEGKLQARLRHRNVVTVLDVIEVEGALALVMELIEGPSLAELLHVQRRPPLGLALGLFRGVVRGVRTAHEQGMIHRDLKPSNVLLGIEGMLLVPKVTDFGIAKAEIEGALAITRTGIALGTPEYMAPEQMRDAARVDARADMFSLGAILYELLCGASPFARSDMIATYRAIEEGDYVPTAHAAPGLPSVLTETVDQLLCYEATRRLASCQALLELLEDPALPQGEPLVADMNGGGGRWGPTGGPRADYTPPTPTRAPGGTSQGVEGAHVAGAAPHPAARTSSPGPWPKSVGADSSLFVGGALGTPLAPPRAPRSPTSVDGVWPEDERAPSPPRTPMPPSFPPGSMGAGSFPPPSLPPHVGTNSAAAPLTLPPDDASRRSGPPRLVLAVLALLVIAVIGVAGAVVGGAGTWLAARPLGLTTPSAPIGGTTPGDGTAAGPNAIQAAPELVAPALSEPVEPISKPPFVVPSSAEPAPKKPVAATASAAASVAAPSPPAAATAPAAAPATVRVEAEGDANKVALRVGGRDVVLPGSVAPGTYVIRAWFGEDGAIDAGSVTLSAGATVRLRCSSFQLRCQ